MSLNGCWWKTKNTTTTEQVTWYGEKEKEMEKFEYEYRIVGYGIIILQTLLSRTRRQWAQICVWESDDDNFSSCLLSTEEEKIVRTFSISLHNALCLSSPPSKKHIIKVIFQYSSTFLHFWVSTTNMNVEQTTSLHFVSLLLSRKSIHAPAVDVKNDFPRHETRFDGWLTRSFVYLLLLLIVGYNRLLSVRSQKWLFNLNSAQLLLLPSSIFHRSNDSEVRHERWSRLKWSERNQKKLSYI